MNWLLWKDYRINRLIIITGIVLLLVPHLIGLYATCREAIIGHPESGKWLHNLGISSMFSLMVSQLTVALIGGNAIASERVDRSAEFLHTLPFTRKKILVSKLLLALIVTAVIWLNALIIGCLLWATHEGAHNVRPDDTARLLQGGINIAATGLTMFCVGWFLSSLLSSPTIAASGGLIAPLAVVFGILFVGYLFEIQDFDKIIEPWYRGICLTIAPACFAIGTWHYLRSVEP
jgi:ABC-type transport system involved in multi-copper enzyme maturation permease subunit